MKQNKVREVQKYLADRGIKVSEVSIVNTAIDIAREFGEGNQIFLSKFGEKK
jgi:inosine/xanthosine triphosphate pyrophosphatase family protein